MKIGSFTTANDKGQIVIPKDIRDALAIESGATLNIIKSGNGIYIYLVEEFITRAETESSYLQLLEKTQGKWSNDSDVALEQKRSLLELKASKARKELW